MSVQAPATRRRPRSRFLAILVYTLQSCFPPRRWFALLLPCAGALFFGLIAHSVHGTRGSAFANVAAEGILSLMLPVAVLVIGDAVLGAEVRAGTFQYTWLSPTPTWQIVLGRWVGGSLIALVTIVPATALAAVVAGASGDADAVAVAAAFAAIAYVAIFIAIGCLTRRTAVWSLAFVFLIERLLGAALTGIAQISPTWLGRSIYVSYINDVPSRLVRTGIPSGSGAIVRLLVVSLVALALANWRMRHMRLSGASD